MPLKTDAANTSKKADVVLRLDSGLLARIDHEVALLARAAAGAQRLPGGRKPRKVPRLPVMRDLIREALDRRALERGEDVPRAEPFGHFPDLDEEGEESADALRGRAEARISTRRASAERLHGPRHLPAQGGGGASGPGPEAQLAREEDLDLARDASAAARDLARDASAADDQARRTVTGLGLAAARLGKVHLKTLGVKPKIK